jgi:glycosyltransferase involved in cell wall biosynthesis
MMGTNTPVCGVAWSEQCAVVIPCLNEGETIDSLVKAVRRQLPAVIVVDDGSVDGTAALAASAGARVVAHDRNRGKGAALKTGLSAALERGHEWAFTMDGDGQHKPEDLPAFLDCATRTRAMLVIGNRLHQPQALPWLRRLVNRWMSRRISRRTGQPLPDTQCGFRLLDLKAWGALSLRAERFEAESETLLAFLAAGHRVEFVPIQVVGRGPHSHIRPLADTWRWLKWWHDSGRG